MAVHLAESPLSISAACLSMPFIHLVQNIMVFLSLLRSPLTTHSTWPPLASAPSLCLLDLSLSSTATSFSLPYTELHVAALSLHWAEQVVCSLPETASRLLWRAQGLLLCSASPAEGLQFFGILNTTSHTPLPSQTVKALEIFFAFDEFLPIY